VASNARSVPVLEPERELSWPFMQRALERLRPHLGPDTLLLEIRATGRVFSVQFDQGNGQLRQLDYSELRQSGAGGTQGDKSAASVGSPHKEPVGRLLGPDPIEVRGDGPLEENMFRFSEIDLERMSAAFGTARRAIDPQDGKIERLVVRRYLPFSVRIRARIFVKSPRMSGSIDTNEHGVVLKR
jgi:hypothetical protein